MFCQNCGKEIPDDSRICQYCGSDPRNLAIKQGNNDKQFNASKMKESNKNILIVFIVIVVLAAIVGAYFLSISISDEIIVEPELKTIALGDLTMDLPEDYSKLGDSSAFNVSYASDSSDIVLSITKGQGTLSDIADIDDDVLWEQSDFDNYSRTTIDGKEAIDVELPFKDNSDDYSYARIIYINQEGINNDYEIFIISSYEGMLYSSEIQNIIDSIRIN